MPFGDSKHVKCAYAKQFKQTKHLGETLGQLGKQTSQALLCLPIVNGLLGKLRQAAWLRNIPPFKAYCASCSPLIFLLPVSFMLSYGILPNV